MGNSASVSAQAKTIGNEAFRAGDFHKAAAAYTRAIEADATDPALVSNRSAAWLSLKKYGWALVDARRCVELAPRWAKAHWREGCALAALQRYVDAHAAFLRSHALEPTDAAIRKKLEDAAAVVNSKGGCGAGYLLCWGEDADGQCGMGGSRGRLHATVIDAIRGRQVLDVACGLSHTVIVTVNGDCMAWGNNKHSQCGCSPGFGERVSAPVVIGELLGRSVVGVACGGGHSLALCADGGVYAWGTSAHGQCGVGISGTVASPTRVLGLDEVKGVCCGFAHSVFALVSEGVMCCGWNKNGQLGVGDTTDRFKPTMVVGELAAQCVSNVACGAAHTVFVTGGSLYCCGSASCGQLGMGAASQAGALKDLGTEKLCEDVTSPTVVPFFNEIEVVVASCGEEYTVVATADSQIYAFGLGNVGQLGTGDSTMSAVPVLVQGVPEQVVSFACTQNKVMAITASGDMFCWGAVEDSSGQYADLLKGKVEAAAPHRSHKLRRRHVLRLECGRRHFIAAVSGSFAGTCSLYGHDCGQVAAGKRFSFKITARDEMGRPRDQGGDRFEVSFIHQNGDCFMDSYIDDNADGTYDVNCRLKVAGVYSIIVTLDGVDIKDSPFMLSVNAHNASSTTSELDSSVLQRSDLLPDSSVLAMLHLRDQYGNAVEGEVGTVGLSASLDGERLGVKFESSGVGCIDVCPKKCGAHSLAVRLGGEHVKGSPVEFVVRSLPPYGPSCSFEGMSLKEKTVVAGDTFQTTIRVRDYLCEATDASPECVEVKILPVGGKTCEKSSVVCEGSRVTVSFMPTLAVAHSVHVAIGGQAVMGSPLLVTVKAGRMDPSKTIVEGAGLEGCTTRTPAPWRALVVRTFDAYRNSCGVGGADIAVRFGDTTGECVDVQDGRYYCGYFAASAGSFQLKVECNGVKVPPTPCQVVVAPDPVAVAAREREAALKRQALLQNAIKIACDKLNESAKKVVEILPMAATKLDEHVDRSVMDARRLFDECLSGLSASTDDAWQAVVNVSSSLRTSLADDNNQLRQSAAAAAVSRLMDRARSALTSSLPHQDLPVDDERVEAAWKDACGNCVEDLSTDVDSDLLEGSVASLESGLAALLSDWKKQNQSAQKALDDRRVIMQKLKQLNLDKAQSEKDAAMLEEKSKDRRRASEKKRTQAKRTGGGFAVAFKGLKQL